MSSFGFRILKFVGKGFFTFVCSHGPDREFRKQVTEWKNREGEIKKFQVIFILFPLSVPHKSYHLIWKILVFRHTILENPRYWPSFMLVCGDICVTVLIERPLPTVRRLTLNWRFTLGVFWKKEVRTLDQGTRGFGELRYVSLTCAGWVTYPPQNRSSRVESVVSLFKQWRIYSFSSSKYGLFGPLWWN